MHPNGYHFSSYASGYQMIQQATFQWTSALSRFAKQQLQTNSSTSFERLRLLGQQHVFSV